MNVIHISASREYDVCVGRGLLDKAGRRIAEVTGVCTAAVISDDTVFGLYGRRVCDSLEAAGFRVVSYVFPHGERSKNLEIFGKLQHFLSENRLTRSDIVVALGGGVTGDLAGFVAATYQRGIRFVQIPTSLLACVDSSVGGKTAIDLDTGKNQVGAFHQPSLVLCDPEVLATLPEEQLRCGCAEVIKYAMMGNKEFFYELKQTPVEQQVEHVIATCVGMKRDVVKDDEFDRGRRQFLNLGHSVGHAVEACSNLGILHGQAVAIGMSIITRAAVQRGICSEETLQELLALLEQYQLPTSADYPLEQILQVMFSDKKVAGSTINLVVPEAVGLCRLETVPTEEMQNWLRAGGIL